MRKFMYYFILCLVLLVAIPHSTLAANKVNTIDIQAVIYEDGSMNITQNWEGSFEEQRSMEQIEKLVTAFKTVAFPGTTEQSFGLGAAQAVHTNVTPPTDAIEEIKKYKALMEEGIISQQEFDAKKKQLLGI